MFYRDKNDFDYSPSLEDRRESFSINDDISAPPNRIKNEENRIQPLNAKELFNQSTNIRSSTDEGGYSYNRKLYNLLKDSEQNNFQEKIPGECSSDDESGNDESKEVFEPKSNKDNHNQNPPSEKQKEKTPTPKYITYNPSQYKKYKKREKRIKKSRF